MRIFKTRTFARSIRKEAISDEDLRIAVMRAMAGGIDANLGGGLVKQRIARAGGGKSGGYQTFIAYHPRSRAVYLFHFAKSDRDNVAADALRALKAAAGEVLNFTEFQIARALRDGDLLEIENE